MADGEQCGNAKAGDAKPVITAEYILGLLRQKFIDSKYACAAEVGNSTGANCRRHIDFMVMNLWPSDGYRIDGFEIKISRSDMRRELQMPEKHNIFFDDIDTFTLVCPTNVIDLSITPPKWGVMAVENGGLKVVRKPLALRDDHKAGLNHGFVASLMRSVSCQSLERRVLADMLEREFKRGYAEGKENVSRGGKIVCDFEYREYQWMKKFCSDIGVCCEYQTRDLSEGMKNLRGTICDFSSIEQDLKRAEKAIGNALKAFGKAPEARKFVEEIGRKNVAETHDDSCIEFVGA